MAGDWIKMRSNLWDDPRVARLCDLTESGEAAVIGALYWLWATADQHSADGIMPGLTPRAIDRKTGVQGIGAALIEIGWIADHPEGIRIVRFEDHNGASAKSRAQTARRVEKHRAVDDVTQQPLQERNEIVTPPLAREEKRREEKELKSKAEARASRLPDDWEPSSEDLRFIAEQRKDLEVGETYARFRDYWTSKAGKDARKSDWSATWRNWVRNEKPPLKAKAASAWWATDSTVLAKGVELNMRPRPGESIFDFKSRVQAAIDNGGVEPRAPPVAVPIVEKIVRVNVDPATVEARRKAIFGAVHGKVIS